MTRKISAVLVLAAAISIPVAAYAAGIACATSEATPAPGLSAPAQSLSTSVTLAPGTEPGSYLATVEISDAMSKEILMAPIIAFMKGGGEPTMTSGTFPNGDKITFLIEVDEAGSSATYSAELKHGDKSISVQKATIRLGK